MAGKAAVLLVTDAAALPATVVLWAVQTFEEKSASGKGLSVITNVSQLGGKVAAEASSVDVIISLVETPGRHTAAWLHEAARILRPGGLLWVQEPLACRDVASEERQRLGAATVQTQAALERGLLLAGFVGSKVVECVEGVGLAESCSGITSVSVGSSQGPLLKPVAVSGQKPAWETGSSFVIKKKAAVEQDLATGSSFSSEAAVQTNGATVRLSSRDVTDVVLPVSNSWKVAPVGDDMDELVDEDALLTEDDIKPPELPIADDCEVGKAGKKACKNCSCGRAEIEEKEEVTKLTAARINNPKSACGSCGLGDAFRCGGCPYQGLPPFKLGEKITLAGSLLVADA